MIHSRRTVWGVWLIVAAAATVAGWTADNSLRASLARYHNTTDSSQFSTYTASAAADGNIGLDADLRPLELVTKVLRIVKDNYVDPVDPFDNEKMAHNAVKFMVASLGDSNSRFLDASQANTLAQMAQGAASGIGAVIKIREVKGEDYTDQRLTIVAPLSGSPAEKAGLLSGDVIDSIDGKWVMSHDPYSEAYKLSKDYTATVTAKKKAFKDAEELKSSSITLDSAYDKLMNSADGELTLKVLQNGKARTVKVARAQVRPPSVTARMLEDGVAYIHMGILTPGSGAEFQKALGEMRSAGASRLVLDLRNSPGGAVTAAQQIAGAIAPGAKLATVLRSGRGKENIWAGRDPKSSPMNVVGLVNEGTEGVSELLAAGLHDSASVKLIGNVTWGNGMETTAIRLADGSGYTLTTGKYLTPRGVDYNRKGIKPDAVVPMSPGKIGSPDDAQLARAVLVARRPAA